MAKKLRNFSKTKFDLRVLVLIIALLFIGIRLLNLSQAIGFGTDQGRDFLNTWRMVQDRRIVVLGPPSQYSINGRAFFFGPAPYYVILPALLVGSWSPLFVSYYIILLNLVVLLVSLFLLNQQKVNRRVLLIFTFLCIFAPLSINSTRSYWNPYFMFPVSLLLLPLLIMSEHRKSHDKFFFVLIGFLFGLGLQFHYSFILTIAMGMTWLLINKKLSFISLASISIGFVLGFLPIIAYELKSGFYNLRTLLLVFTSPSSQNQFSFNGYYYLISLFPFFFFLLSLILAKFKNKVLLPILGVCLLWSLVSVLQAKKSNLDYSTLQTLTAAIEADNPNDFNVVDQLTRDNQGMAVRYLLTVHGFPPHLEGEYKTPHEIYIYSKEPLAKLLQNPIYEIKSFLPFKTAMNWKLENGIQIYKLEK